jgi:hypothetical protein
MKEFARNVILKTKLGAFIAVNTIVVNALMNTSMK